jgi:hypothetical protein
MRTVITDYKLKIKSREEIEELRDNSSEEELIKMIEDDDEI